MCRGWSCCISVFPVTAFCKVKPGPTKLELSVKLPQRKALADWETGL